MRSSSSWISFPEIKILETFRETRIRIQISPEEGDKRTNKQLEYLFDIWRFFKKRKRGMIQKGVGIIVEFI